MALPNDRINSRGCPAQAPLGRGFSLRPAQLGNAQRVLASVPPAIRFPLRTTLPSESGRSSTTSPILQPTHQCPRHGIEMNVASRGPNDRTDSRGCPAQAPLGRGFSLRPAQLGNVQGVLVPVLSTAIRFSYAAPLSGQRVAKARPRPIHRPTPQCPRHGIEMNVASRGPNDRTDSRGCPAQAPRGRGFS
jgi:hypothetical protein